MKYHLHHGRDIAVVIVRWLEYCAKSKRLTLPWSTANTDSPSLAKSSLPLHHPHIPLHIPLAQQPERLGVAGRVVAGDGRVQRIELDQHHALLLSRLPDLLRHAECE